MTDLRWTRETPTGPGWYWFRSPDWATDRMSEVAFVDPDADVVEWAGAECSGSLEQMVGGSLWAGPIPEPKGEEE